MGVTRRADGNHRGASAQGRQVRDPADIEREIAHHRRRLFDLALELAEAKRDHGEGYTNPTESPIAGHFPGMRLSDITYTFNPPSP